MTLDRDAVELLPCPFCGASAREQEPESASGLWEVGCPGNWRQSACAVGAAALGSTRAEAIATWNRRAPLEALSAREATEGGEAVRAKQAAKPKHSPLPGQRPTDKEVPVLLVPTKAGEPVTLFWRGEQRGQIALTPEERDALNPILPHPEGEPTAQVEAATQGLLNAFPLDDKAAQAYARVALRSASIPPSGVAGEPLSIIYTNWRGETAERTIMPLRMWFGSTEWHPEPQWLLTAIDIEKNAERDFAWSGIDFQGGVAEARAEALEAAAQRILPYLRWTIGPESPGHHPTLPSAIAALESALIPSKEAE